MVTKDFTDARGLIIKDFTGCTASATELTASGGKFQFNNIAFWRTLKASTLIVIRVQYTMSGYVEDTDATDKILDLRLENSNYFTNVGGQPFNVQNFDMVLLKQGGAAGVANGIHAAAFGIPLTNNTFSAVNCPKMCTDKISPTGGMLFAKNSTETIADFNGEDVE
ncbi:hypothetical protein [Pedobacter sp. SL55]|uniref:hypothetical protein n=1 Tax=Pedobacter sp. SL55 TaxID=2995161 RepID=UPI00226D6302|nr:hypothetical protein [Pedobacter sp. SL55]WAC40108.1 hypothetical protein OVA16_16210 [Pedobacter sp. SL55]